MRLRAELARAVGVVDLAARVHELHGEHAVRREAPEHLRDAQDAGVNPVPEHRPREVRVAPLLREVELLEERPLRLGEQPLQVELREEPGHHLHELPQHEEVVLHLSLQVRVLHLDAHLAAVEERAAVHLREGRRCERLRRYVAEHRLQRPRQLLLYRLAHDSEGPGLGLVLQHAQPRRVLPRQDVVEGAEVLPQLRVAPAVLEADAQQPRRRALVERRFQGLVLRFSAGHVVQVAAVVRHNQRRVPDRHRRPVVAVGDALDLVGVKRIGPGAGRGDASGGLAPHAYP
mmetsp:Transcript_27537/g.87163  ORF Transcript_27537/g.87163 Transcript_27537/m.87163 type:complete len:288 (+) Transcript_27537:1127-1990(+)